MKYKTIVIIGAGPAGLTAAYELATRSNYKVIVLEADAQVGGISKTVDYKGNKIDIGGHRFFSKSDWVLDWWQLFLPILNNGTEIHSTYQNQQKSFSTEPFSDGKKPHMLVRPRKSRIYYNGKLIDYPLKLTLNTLFKIGVWKSLSILLSLIANRLSPIKEEKNLEDFYINRFGKKLYEVFFKEYTEKVWGKPCTEISPEWGRQRVKGLSFKKIIRHYFTTLFYPMRQNLGNKQVEQTLTEYFLYPQKGPGQLWETVAERCITLGVDIRTKCRVEKLNYDSGHVISIEVYDKEAAKYYTIHCDQVISTMPVKDLMLSLSNKVPKKIFDVASNLEYRDFMIVGLLVDELSLKNQDGSAIDDNWLYIQDQGLHVGRVQLFHNWSPYMTIDNNKAWIGAEFFCKQDDKLWTKSNEELIKLASSDLASIGMLEANKVTDGTVVRMPKAYPSYVGSYEDFDVVKNYFNTISNLYLVGRNGTHRYNNQDHSMLSAKEAVDNIVLQKEKKENIWSVNTEESYHESTS